MVNHLPGLFLDVDPLAEVEKEDTGFCGSVLMILLSLELFFISFITT